jgi:hypothetical protein
MNVIEIRDVPYRMKTSTRTELLGILKRNLPEDLSKITQITVDPERIEIRKINVEGV